MKLNELIYDLKETVRGNISNMDSIDDRQLEFWVHNQRSLWIKNELNKTFQISSSYIQDLGSIKIEHYDFGDTISLDPSMKIYRTTVEIPPMINRHNTEAIISIGSGYPNKIPFNIITPDRAPYVGNGRFDTSSIYAFLMDRYVYVIFKEENYLYNTVSSINIRGILENPTDASKFTKKDGTVCWTKNSEYPITRSLYNYMKGEILKLDLKVKATAPSDKETDGNDNLTNSIKV